MPSGYDDEPNDRGTNPSWPDVFWLVAGIGCIGGAIWVWFVFAS
jgi:hypothetical protein